MAARRAVTAVLYGWGFDDPQWLHGAALVVSELVSNAVRHGGGCIDVTVQLHDETVTIAAADGSSVVPCRRDPDDNGGRGLLLIEALCTRWGINDHEGGKRVWVELAPAPGQAPRPSGTARDGTS